MVVSVAVGFRQISISRWEVLLMIVKSRKLMQSLDSSVGLNYKSVCIELVYCVMLSWFVLSVS